MTVQYDLHGQKKAYATWAGFYDRVYSGLLADGQSRLAAAAGACGPRILEVGIGTGLTLRYYPKESSLVGVDLSLDMLQKSVGKISNDNLHHVAGVAAMDACRLGFPNGAFDAVTFPFVITLVPDPEGALDEAARVLRPGGEIIIASKVSRDSGFITRMEEKIAPLARQVGWSSAFKFSRLTKWARARGDFEVLEVSRLFPAGFFKLMRFRKQG